MNEDRPMSAFAGIAACLALPGRSGARPAEGGARRMLAAPRVDAGPKKRRWWAMLGLSATLAVLSSPLPAAAQVSIQIGLPGIEIGINQPVYPQLVAVPGYPVYYDPGSSANYFFYDGMYWVFQGDNWYASSWYNGPWALVGPQYVPVFLYRIPVRYYRHPPAYFRGWSDDAPPRWGDHWGHDWERQHSGWDRWDHRSVPPPAPLPVYQRQYSGNRYPPPEQQHELRTQNYRYQPRDEAVKQVHQAQEQARRQAPQQQEQQKQQQAQQNKGQEQQRQQEQQKQQQQQQAQQNKGQEQQRQQEQQKQQAQLQQSQQKQQQQAQQNKGQEQQRQQEQQKHQL